MLPMAIFFAHKKTGLKNLLSDGERDYMPGVFPVSRSSTGCEFELKAKSMLERKGFNTNPN